MLPQTAFHSPISFLVFESVSAHSYIFFYYNYVNVTREKSSRSYVKMLLEQMLQICLLLFIKICRTCIIQLIYSCMSE